MHWFLKIYFWNKTLHVTDSSSVHHQQFFYCTHSNGICNTGLVTACEQDQGRKSWSCVCCRRRRAHAVLQLLHARCTHNCTTTASGFDCRRHQTASLRHNSLQNVAPSQLPFHRVHVVRRQVAMALLRTRGVMLTLPYTSSWQEELYRYNSLYSSFVFCFI